MEFQYHGGNCISISTKNVRMVIDDNLTELGLKSVAKPDDVALFTSTPNSKSSARLVFMDPGEYEASEVSVFGMPARAHMDEEDKQTATIYKLQYNDFRIAIIGHVHPDINEESLEELGAIDILFIPVGGNGYTLDGIGALSVIKNIEPKVVIPTHYDDPDIKYPVPQQPLAEALKGLAMEVRETVPKFKPKYSDLSDGSGLIVLERR